MRKIAILCGKYLPGFKDGGPVRTLINITECLGDEYDFKIITGDRDHGDTEPYPNITYDAPNRVGKADVWYLPPKGFTFKKIKQLTKDVDVIYCFGPYDGYSCKSMILKRFGKIKQPLVIASMGTFSKGALGIKSFKKKLFFRVCKFFGLFKRVVWSVTSKIEEQDVKRVVGDNAKCYIAEDLPRKIPEYNAIKEEGPLRIIFLSRICEKKNLLYAIKVLNKIQEKVVFDIYGPKEDNDYWQKCEKTLKELPKNITWNYKGLVDTVTVIDVFAEYDVFIFPTLGENYGHVIFESLAGGCIPIISDQTPWLDLENKNSGYVIPLKNESKFIEIINTLSQISMEEKKEMAQNAVDYARQKYIDSINETGYRIVFGLDS